MSLILNGPSCKRRPYKTIIIPKGVISPYENSVIEIPVQLDTNNSLIVRGARNSHSCLTVEPYYCSSAYDLTTSNNAEVSSSAAGSTSAIITPTPVATSTPVPLTPPVNSTTPTPPITTQPEVAVGPHVQQAGLHRYQLPYLYQFQTSHSARCSFCDQITPRCLRPYTDFLKPTISKSREDLRSGLTNHEQHPRLNYLHKTRSFSSAVKPKSERITRPVRRPGDRDENVILNKLIENKIDKILKPLLFSLARLWPDEKQREITSKYSCNSLERKSSTERCYPRKFLYSPCPDFDDLKETRPHNRIIRSYSPEQDYDALHIKIKTSCGRSCDYQKSTVVTGGNRMKMKEEDSDEDIYKQRRSKSSRRPNVDGNLQENVNFEIENGTSDLTLDSTALPKSNRRSSIGLNHRIT